MSHVLLYCYRREESECKGDAAYRFLIRVRFHYKRGMEYSLSVLLIVFAFLSARLDFKRRKINKRNKECSIARSLWKRALTKNA